MLKPSTTLPYKKPAIYSEFLSKHIFAAYGSLRLLTRVQNCKHAFDYQPFFTVKGSETVDVNNATNEHSDIFPQNGMRLAKWNRLLQQKKRQSVLLRGS